MDPHHAPRPVSNRPRGSRLAIAAGLLPLATAECARAAEWAELRDKSLTQWDTYLAFRHRVGYTGKPPVDADNKPIEPFGYGKIQLQSEGSEVFHSGIRITPIDAMPAEYAPLFG